MSKFIDLFPNMGCVVICSTYCDHPYNTATIHFNKISIIYILPVLESDLERKSKADRDCRVHPNVNQTHTYTPKSFIKGVEFSQIFHFPLFSAANRHWTRGFQNSIGRQKDRLDGDKLPFNNTREIIDLFLCVSGNYGDAAIDNHINLPKSF